MGCNSSMNIQTKDNTDDRIIKINVNKKLSEILKLSKKAKTKSGESSSSFSKLIFIKMKLKKIKSKIYNKK